MARSAIVALALIGAMLVASGGPPAAGPAPADTGALPPVSTAPEPSDAPDVAPVAPDAVAAIHDELAWRHTGLSPSEVRAVAEAVVREAEQHDVDPELVLAVIQVESGGYNFAVSRVGAVGLMQVMPATGEAIAGELGLPWHGPDTLFDPMSNIAIGVAYLRKLESRYGSWPAALAAYNWGPGRIDRRLRRGMSLPRIYVQQVMEALEPDGSERARS